MLASRYAATIILPFLSRGLIMGSISPPRKPRLPERFAAHGIHERHRHRAGYLSIVLEGQEIEAGDEGRRLASPGDVLMHFPFDCHCNYVGSKSLSVLCLPLPMGSIAPSSGVVADVDTIVAIAERDGLCASECAIRHTKPSNNRLLDWPDLLAEDLRSGESFRLADWADAKGLAPETVSRGFRRIYGTSPARFRVELRARRAWTSIVHSDDSLANIALNTGFADQAHMSRSVATMTGRSPKLWRQIVGARSSIPERRVDPAI